METNSFNTVILGWALLFPLACLLGLVMECIRPTVRWTRYAIGITLLSGALGIGLNLNIPGKGDPFIWPLVLDVFFGLALFTLKVADRSKLVRPSRVRKDMLKGEIWEFSSDDAPRLQVLPASGLLLRRGDDLLPSPLPVSIQMAAPIPLHRWEIPAYGLHSAQEQHLLAKRRMEPTEIQEARSLTMAYARSGFSAMVLLLVLSLILGISITVQIQDRVIVDIAFVAPLLLSGLFWCATLTSILSRLKLVKRLKLDIAEAVLVVIRDQDAPRDSSPLAEVLPSSRIIWSTQGKIGPLRQKYLKQARIR